MESVWIARRREIEQAIYPVRGMVKFPQNRTNPYPNRDSLESAPETVESKWQERSPQAVGIFRRTIASRLF